MTAYILMLALIVESITANWFVIRNRGKTAMKLDFAVAVTIVPLVLGIFTYIAFTSLY